MRVHLGIWCRAISIDSITFIFNPSNFLFALSLALARFYLCCIDSPDPYTHTTLGCLYSWLLMRRLVQFSCAVACHENWRFFWVFLFFFPSEAFWLWWHFQCRHIQRTWTQTLAISLSHSFNQSHTPNGNILWWIFAVERTKCITYARLKSSSWDNILSCVRSTNASPNKRKEKKDRHCQSQRKWRT